MLELERSLRPGGQRKGLCRGRGCSLRHSSSFVTILFCKSFMSLRIFSPSSRVQLGLSGGLFGVEVPFLGGMLAKYHF
jgi:hypothetical protein